MYRLNLEHTSQRTTLSKKKRKKSPTAKQVFAKNPALTALSPQNQGFNQRNTRSVKIHIPRKPSR